MKKYAFVTHKKSYQERLTRREIVSASCAWIDKKEETGKANFEGDFAFERLFGRISLEIQNKQRRWSWLRQASSAAASHLCA